MIAELSVGHENMAVNGTSCLGSGPKGGKVTTESIYRVTFAIVRCSCVFVAVFSYIFMF